MSPNPVQSGFVLRRNGGFYKCRSTESLPAQVESALCFFMCSKNPPGWRCRRRECRSTACRSTSAPGKRREQHCRGTPFCVRVFVERLGASYICNFGFAVPKTKWVVRLSDPETDSCLLFMGFPNRKRHPQKTRPNDAMLKACPFEGGYFEPHTRRTLLSFPLGGLSLECFPFTIHHVRAI